MAERPPKQLAAAEFQRLGLLQEINRQVLHPLGLGMWVNTDDSGVATSYGGINDYRRDPEGVYYGWEPGSKGWKAMVKRAQRVAAEWERRREAREAALGFMVQPITVPGTDQPDDAN